MKNRNKLIYWIATGLVSFGMVGSGIAQLLHQKEMEELISHVGYPLYFMYIIGVWKILGVVVLLAPGLVLLKEWAYAGFFFLMTGALISHLAIGDGAGEILGPVFQTIFIMVSWYFRPSDRKINSHHLTV
jgi:uncharacterized membrane protein